ncbi:MAG: helix-turn-helix domain-containing protein, partial [Candidatus Binatia bacterium]
MAKQGEHPELFGSNEEFRATVLKRYENVIAEGIASGKDQERVHSILRVLALIQPVVPDDKHVLELLSTVEGIDGPDASRLARLLIDAGVVFKRGVKFRLSPDLLADSIIESACITSSGASNGYAERVFAASIPEHKEHVLLNLGRLDWRRNEGDTSASRLLDGLWSQLVWEDDYERAQVKAAAVAAYYQPRQALGLARRLVDQGQGKDEDVCRIIRGAAYNLEFLPEACSLLWDAGQNDTRPTNQHPNHPVRILTELATPEPRKPAEFVEGVVDFALSLLDFPESWNGPYTPFDVLRGALATEGHFTSAASSREITISTYAVQRERVTRARHRIVAQLFASFSHANQRRAFLAAQLLSGALRGPIAPPGGDDDPWGDEFVETLQQLDALLSTEVVTAPVLVRIAESVHWHAFYGPDRTRTAACRIIERLDRDIETRTVRALIDAWGSNTWPMEERTGRPQHEADNDALCRELARQHAEPIALARFLHDRLDDIARATGTPDYGPAQLFIGRLLSTNLALARHILHAHLAGEKTQLSPHAGRALGVLLTSVPDEAASLVSRMLDDGEAHLQVIAEGYMFATNLGPYSDVDIVALKHIFASREGRILRYAPCVAHEVARSDKHLAIELLTSVDVDLALRSAPDFFMWLAHDETIPFDLIRDDQLRRVIEGLRGVPRLDDHWLNAFLKKAIRRAPSVVLNLAKVRIDDAIASDDWNKQALGDVLRDRDALELLSLPEGPALLRSLLDWALGRISDYRFSYHFAELVQSLCSPYDATCVAIIEEWLAGGTAKHFKVVTAILRDAGPR